MSDEYNTLRQNIAANVRAGRARLGISQEELAYRADIDRTYVSQIERCVNNPSLQVLCKVGHALGVSTISLLTVSDLSSQD
ncbi:MAG TPA: helix-turn-helix transcriptional regulator [Ottowia sp.]|uniref:helix-turn-helix domain-containing protein n=1 Tax=Ottowia sp. TaxID=1898956 RepID=UPI002B6944C9|nr:helix-turn-helix transcriptional regulator [Ottowia sp.]HPZ56151.1 helix-turn-helix transcriptional regulator [Ottowia sp.]